MVNIISSQKQFAKDAEKVFQPKKVEGHSPLKEIIFGKKGSGSLRGNHIENPPKALIETLPKWADKNLQKVTRRRIESN